MVPDGQRSCSIVNPKSKIRPAGGASIPFPPSGISRNWLIPSKKTIPLYEFPQYNQTLVLL